MNKGSILSVTAIAALTCFVACERVPQNSIDDARAALERADNAGGRNWTPTQLKAGHAFYDSAMKEISLEKKKLPFMRKYKKASDLLDLANEAGHYTVETMESARKRCVNLLGKAKVLTDSTEIRLSSATVKKTDIKRLQAALDSAKMFQKEAHVLLESSDLQFAEDKAIEAFNKSEDVANGTNELLAR
jgi:hypothetical protein